MSRSIKQWILPLLLSTTLLLSSCGEPSTDEETHNITVGFGPSTYIDQFEKGIKPLLEAEGFTVDIKVLSQNIQLNPTMKEGVLDATVFQSEAYMHDMNAILGMEMIKLADTASAPQSLRSERHQSLDAIEDGMLITIPNDPVNAERAARLLEELGWITLPDDLDIATFNAKAIQPGDYQLEIREIDPAQSLRTLADVDFAVVNGNYIANAGLKMSDGLAIESTPDQHVVIVTILAEDRDKAWAKALKKAYESKEFEDYIHSEPLYEGFILPKVWSDRVAE